MPSGSAVGLRGVRLELQNRSRLTRYDFGQKRRGGRFRRNTTGWVRELGRRVEAAFARPEELDRLDRLNDIATDSPFAD